jgi:hypothetical protein
VLEAGGTTEPEGCSALCDYRNGRIIISWTDTNGSVVGYDVYRSDDGGPYTLLATTAAGAEQYLDTDLENTYTRYRYRVYVEGSTSLYCETEELACFIIWGMNQVWGDFQNKWDALEGDLTAVEEI